MTKRIQICIFEDIDSKQLSPYQLTRPVYTIPNGMYNLVQKIATFSSDSPLTLLCQPNHEAFLKQRFPKININKLNKSLPTLFINGRVNFSYSQFKAILADINYKKNNLYINNKNIIAIYSNDSLMESIYNVLHQRPSFDDIISQFRNQCQVKEKKNLQLIDHWWDFLKQFPVNISKDFELFSKKSLIEGDVSTFSVLINDHDMFIDVTSKISEYVSLDATNGPIIIMDNVTVKPFSRIEGPCFIGSNTVIQSHSNIASSYIGQDCKIGGELKGSIFQSFSNKGHFGFVGDSLIGEWVNLGAGTTTSNLKLSYGDIRSSNGFSTEPIKSNQQFLGSLFGDYVKTSIHSSFDCGSVISNCCSLYGSDTHSKFIPPFTWGKKDHYLQQDIGAFLTALNRTMSRRNRTLTEEESIKLKTIFDHYREVRVLS